MKFATIAALGLGLTAAQIGFSQETKTKAETKKADAPAAAAGDTKAETKKGDAPAAAGVSKEVLDTVCYGIGLRYGRELKNQPFELNTDILLKGINDGLNGGKPKFTDAQILAAMQVFQKEMLAKLQAEAKIAGEKGKKEGNAFLAANANKPGVKKTKSGLQYKVIKEGTGKVPTADDTVKTNYKGMLIDGTVFDSSEQNGGPISFPVTGVIKGWTEALQMMKVGSKYTLYIPSDLAYGPAGHGAAIPPNSTLIFDLELLGIE